MARKTLLAWTGPLVFLTDRFLKTLVTNRYPEGDGFHVIPGVFHVTRVNNTGAAFGLLKDTGVLLALVSLISIFILTVYFLQKRGRGTGGARGAQPFAYALVIGGAAGNLYDRLRYGYVIDFLDFRIWPVFNVADVSICVGAFLILTGLWRRSAGGGS